MMGLLRRVAAALGLAALCWTTGCAGFWVAVGNSNSSGTGNTTNDYVYVANATASTLSGYAVGTGTLTAVSGSPYSLGFVPTAAAVNPANTIVFVAGSNGIYGFVNSYSIGTGGALSLLVSNNLLSASEVAIDVSPDGNWLLGVDATGPLINEAIVDVYQINSSTGQLTQGTGAIFTYTGAAPPTIVPSAIKFAPNGDYVFVALGTAGDLVFPFNTSSNTPLSTPLSLSLAGSNNADNALAVSSDEKYLFIARSGTNGGLAAYTIGSGGSLAPVSGSPFAAATQPFSVVVNLAGTDVYVANRGSNTISGFSIASGGPLTALSGSPYQSGSAVTALAVDRSGNYLLAAANGGSPDLTMYSYDSTTAGKLDFSTSIATGTDPTGPVALATTH